MSRLAIEIIGVFATVLILVATSFKTLSLKGSLWMRGVNIIGSIILVIYGALLPAISTIVLNGALIMINCVHLGILIRDDKKKKINKKKEDIENGNSRETGK